MVGKKRKRPEDPQQYCPKCDRVQKVIHSRRYEPWVEDTSICKTCHTMFPRSLGQPKEG